MAFAILGNPAPQFVDSSGSPYSSGTIEVRNPADDTLKSSYPTYDDAEALTNVNAGIITLNDRGIPQTQIWGIDGEDYKLIIKDEFGATIDTIDDYNLPDIETQASVGQLLYPRTQAEIDVVITPTNYNYEEGDSRRYGALFDDSTDDTTAHQTALDVLAQKDSGVWRIEGGISRAQGLVCKADYLEIAGSGWLKPVSNTTTPILRFGDDTTSTICSGITGTLRIGDSGGVLTTWPNVKGVNFEALNESNMFLHVLGLGVGIEIAPSDTGISYNNFYLGDVTNNKVAIRFNVQPGGWANENVWIGGRFAINSSTWESGVCDIQMLDNGGTTVNGNVFIKPSFEGDGRCIHFDNATNNTVLNARWEGPSPGTEDVDFDSVFFKIESDCNYNNIELSQGFDWLLSDTKAHGAADLRNSNGSFTFNSVDKTPFFYKGAPVKVTVSGTTYTSFVTRSLFSSGNTRVYIAHPWITSAPTAVETARVEDEGFTEFRGPTINTLDGVTSVQGGLHTSQRVAEAHLLHHMVVSAMTGNNPVFVHSEPEVNTNRFLEVRDAAAALEYWIDGRGHSYQTALSVGDVTTPIASRTHVADPAGGGTVDAEARTAINAILASLEAFGFHSTS